VSSSDEGKVRGVLGSEVAVVPTPQDLLSRPDVDLVVIASPNESHVPLAKLAVEQGKDVILEKPVAVVASEVAELAELAAAKGRLVIPFHNRRWDSDFLTLRALYESGQLGEMREFHSHFDRFRPEVRDRWRERAVPGGGILYDLGPHLIDQALVLFGRPDAVSADIVLQRDGALTDDYVHLTLRYGVGRVHLHAGMLVGQVPTRFALHGTGGSFVCSGMDPQEAALRAGTVPGGAGWGSVPPADSGRLWRVGDAEATRVVSKPGDYLAYYSAVRLSLTSRSVPPPVSLSDASLGMLIIEAAIKSSEERRELSWDEVCGKRMKK
jgi:predicted dehydrogenase